MTWLENSTVEPEAAKRVSSRRITSAEIGSTPSSGSSRNTTTWPASGRSSPVIIDRDVVLPAPFGPTSPASEPAAMSRSIPATASFSAKLLRSPRTSIAGSPVCASSAAVQLVHDDPPGHRLRADSVGELARGSELVGDDQLLVGIGYLNTGPDEDVVTVDGNGRIGPGGKRRLQQDRAGGGVERVQVTAVGGGEHDVVGDRGGAVRRRRELVIPDDLSGVLVNRDHLACRLGDRRLECLGSLRHALDRHRHCEVVDGGEYGRPVGGQLGFDAAEHAGLEVERGRQRDARGRRG